MESKKISFGFSKQLKKTNIFSPNLNKINDKEPTNIQLIDCLEANSIKIIGGEKEIVKVPLVIPLVRSKVNKNDSKSENNLETNSEVTETVETNLDEIAARELIEESKNITTSVTNSSTMIIPKLLENGGLSGEPESTLDDYDKIPINEFGMAMLRGMGWKDDESAEKNKTISELKIPNVRPKGMGLGADKLIQKENIKVAKNKTGEELKIIKGAFVRIISGRLKNKFGQIQGFDDDSGAVIVKMALDNSVETLQEFLLTPVTKEDYGKNSKVLNLDKYENYHKKKDEMNKQQIINSKSSRQRESESDVIEVKVESKTVEISSDSDIERLKKEKKDDERFEKSESSRHRSRDERNRDNSSRKEHSNKKSKHKNKKHDRRHRDSSDDDRRHRDSSDDDRRRHRSNRRKSSDDDVSDQKRKHKKSSRRKDR